MFKVMIWLEGQQKQRDWDQKIGCRTETKGGTGCRSRELES